MISCCYYELNPSKPLVVYKGQPVQNLPLAAIQIVSKPYTMSEKALGDINMPSELEGKTEISGNGSLVKPQVEYVGQNMPSELEGKTENSSNGSLVKPEVEHVGQNLADLQRDTPALFVKSPANGDGGANNGGEVGHSEVEYIESENLNDIEDVDLTLKTILAGLDSKDWVLVCDALNNLRRLSIYHKEATVDMLGSMIPLIVKSLKNPRSAVCKTALMTSSDIFKAYGDDIIDAMDPLLVQLLLKASQDKRFVCEAAEKALIAMTTWVSPVLLLPKLQPYLKNRNPRIRAKASMCYSRSVPRLGVDGIRGYGIDKLIQIAASQLSDQLPESREAARILLLELQTVYEKFHLLKTTKVPEETEITSWEHFCQSKLSPLSAQAVLRVTNISTEGLVMGS